MAAKSNVNHQETSLWSWDHVKIFNHSCFPTLWKLCRPVYVSPDSVLQAFIYFILLLPCAALWKACVSGNELSKWRWIWPERLRREIFCGSKHSCIPCPRWSGVLTSVWASREKSLQREIPPPQLLLHNTHTHLLGSSNQWMRSRKGVFVFFWVNTVPITWLQQGNVQNLIFRFFAHV